MNWPKHWGYYTILRKWEENPGLTKREIGVRAGWLEDRPENNLPLSGEEIREIKEYLKVRD